MEKTPTKAPEADAAHSPPVPADVRMARLVELVLVLTGCPEGVAINAVRRAMRRVPASADDAVAVVARAIVSVRRGVDLRDQIDLD